MKKCNGEGNRDAPCMVCGEYGHGNGDKGRLPHVLWQGVHQGDTPVLAICGKSNHRSSSRWARVGTERVDKGCRMSAVLSRWLRSASRELPARRDCYPSVPSQPKDFGTVLYVQCCAVAYCPYRARSTFLTPQAFLHVLMQRDVVVQDAQGVYRLKGAAPK